MKINVKAIWTICGYVYNFIMYLIKFFHMMEMD